ncbi:hypothetical protein D9M68_854210 [compost metagenome]
MAVQRELHDDRVLPAQLGAVQVRRVALDHALGLQALDAAPAGGGREVHRRTDLLQGLARVGQQLAQDGHVVAIKAGRRIFVDGRFWKMDFRLCHQKVSNKSKTFWHVCRKICR